MHGGEERRGSAGSGLPVLSCERQTFGRVITRRTALGVISDSCLFGVFGAHSLYGPRLPPLRLMFRLHLHEEGSCSCQHKQGACEAQVCTCLCFTDAPNSLLLEYPGKTMTLWWSIKWSNIYCQPSVWVRQCCIIILHERVQIYRSSKMRWTSFETKDMPLIFKTLLPSCITITV